MHRLRHARHLTALVLAWFVLALGVAAAAPAVTPAQLEWVCSSDGAARAVLHEPGGSLPTLGHAAKCALCMLAAPPPTLAAARLAPPGRQRAVPMPATGASRVLRAAAPLPPRGPPTSA